MCALRVDVLDSNSDQDTPQGRQELRLLNEQLTDLHESGQVDFFSGDPLNFAITCPRCAGELREEQVIIRPAIDDRTQQPELALDHTENAGDKCDPDKGGTPWYVRIALSR